MWRTPASPVVSGLARGIDAAAHAASAASGTVAVFAGGLDRPYPVDNIDLAESIVAKGGAHVSEMPMGHTPRGKDFPPPQSHHLGMSLAVVVVEAALRSGSLITARLAGEQASSSPSPARRWTRAPAAPTS